jgi:hypothetical protein
MVGGHLGWLSSAKDQLTHSSWDANGTYSKYLDDINLRIMILMNRVSVSTLQAWCAHQARTAVSSQAPSDRSRPIQGRAVDAPYTHR